MSIIGKSLRNAKNHNRQILEHNSHRPSYLATFLRVAYDKKKCGQVTSYNYPCKSSVSLMHMIYVFT